MKRAFLLSMCLAAGACMKPADGPAPAARDLEAGLDPAGFDRGVRPQDDLFRHVNGTWLTKTEIPSDKASYGAFDILFDKAQADLRAIVEEAAKSTTRAPGSEAQKIGDFYESFMDEKRAEELGITPLKAELDAIDASRPRATSPGISPTSSSSTCSTRSSGTSTAMRRSRARTFSTSTRAGWACPTATTT